MGAPVVVDAVWKKFCRGERHDSLRDLVPAFMRRLTSRSGPADLNDQEFWALRDVSFEVRSGEALGVIGPNGAGKSTVLKLLTRILKPNAGHCRVHGRVGALIEVAAGFHQDLTGRENVYLQGAIMGMKRADIARQLDSIVDFAGVEEFIDTPVKRYSSGMNARLGFAIAAHLNPEVLLIDEVLSVGDRAFQARCIERMSAFLKSGASVVFVSHNLQAVHELCTRCVLLDRGRVLKIDAPDACISAYLSRSDGSRGDGDGAGPPEAVRIVGATLTDPFGQPVTAVAPGAPLHLVVQYQARRAAANLSCGFAAFRQADNVCVFDSYTHVLGLRPFAINGGDRFAIRFAFRANLLRGVYDILGHVYDARSARHLDQLRRLTTLTIDEDFSHSGIAHLNLECAVVSAETSSAAAASISA